MTPVIGELEIAGQTVEVSAHVRTERFTITLDGLDLGSGETLEKAKRAAATTLRKRRVKVSVPFALESGERGVADSIHQRNRTVLATIDGSRQELPYSTWALKPVVLDSELDRLAEIEVEIRALNAERAKIIEPYKFQLRDEVDRAVREKAEEEGATDGG